MDYVNMTELEVIEAVIKRLKTSHSFQLKAARRQEGKFEYWDFTLEN